MIPKIHEPIRKPTVYTTSQRRFINQVNAVHCSQRRTHWTESRSQSPSALDGAGGHTWRTRSGISCSQVSWSQVEKSLSSSTKTILSGTMDCAIPLNVYNWAMYLPPGQPSQLTSCNFGTQIVLSHHQISRHWIVSWISLWYRYSGQHIMRGGTRSANFVPPIRPVGCDHPISATCQQSFHPGCLP